MDVLFRYRNHFHAAFVGSNYNLAVSGRAAACGNFMQLLVSFLGLSHAEACVEWKIGMSDHHGAETSCNCQLRSRVGGLHVIEKT